MDTIDGMVVAPTQVGPRAGLNHVTGKPEPDGLSHLSGAPAQVSEFTRPRTGESEDSPYPSGVPLGGHEHLPGSALVVKNYNPLSGKEILEMILSELRRELELHPDLGETLSYPRAVVEFRLRFDIHQWPLEEERHKRGDIYKRWENDIIPPDAQRILSALPVPTPTQVQGSGLDGAAVVVDKMVMADLETETAVHSQFGKEAEELGVPVKPLLREAVTPGKPDLKRPQNLSGKPKGGA